MCGIWAVFGSDVHVSVQCKAAHKVAHRGPDAFRVENINHLQNCCLGFHRLAIVDDVRGMQPMRLYTHPHIWLIYNGEIYNYKSVPKEYGFHLNTDCDGEPIIHLYAKYGIDFPSHLDGVFAFCLLDTANRKVFIGRDTFGVRPCFKLFTDNGFLAVCSEAKGLFGLSHGLTDEAADIVPVAPGTVEQYDLDNNGRATFREKRQFHSIGDMPLYKTPVDSDSLGSDVAENIRVLLETAVKKRLMADRRIGCLLSGGLDSSLVTALMVKNAKEQKLSYPIQTFSIGMEGSTDIMAARKVAKHLNTEHHEIKFTPQDACSVINEVIRHTETYDGSTIRSSIGLYLVSKYIKENTDTVVILSGEGSDELAQGYNHFHKAPSAEAADQESRRLLKDIHMYDVLRGDRATAAWGLEIRVPFLDHQFTSYYLSLPNEDRVPQKGVEKYLLRSAFGEMNLLPKDILWRPKEPFSDGVSAVKRSLYEVTQYFCDEQINDDQMEQAASLFPFNTPRTKEAFYYRQVFENYYPTKSAWIPRMWMPRWEDATDPSETRFTQNGVCRIVSKI
ncbi:asparagine synthetase [glutamine-hydrolyzing]-like [Haliotis rufescens]|uniref:asparagine synthetase [glutamine-hydrolyzing]-like n=1 Tax=Haliotis rufescens TaxID=6454 RepID=UPI00201F17F2|nr:asparagine synthetase [glutamine-hydrolyzing]-like [Haliotis rufescens]